MKKRLFLSFLITILFFGIAYAALPVDLVDREFGKFISTPADKIAVLTTNTGTAPSLTSYFDGRKVTAAAGTALPLSATTLPFSSCTVSALESNTGDILIGASTVDETPATRRGVLLLPASSFTFDLGGDLLYIFIDSEVTGNGVSFFCQQ